MKRLVFIFLFITGCSGSKIIDRPIDFGEERRRLSLEYMNERYGMDRREPLITPKMIVLHWTAIPSLEASFRAFKDPQLPKSRKAISGAGALNVSAHFLVDRDGSIYRLMPENVMARHVIGLNHIALGVENVGGTGETPLTRAQLRANIWLVNYLSRKYEIDYVIGHHEYTNFEGHEYWLEKDDGYRTQKSDPGNAFMEKLRKATRKRGFKEVPVKN